MTVMSKLLSFVGLADETPSGEMPIDMVIICPNCRRQHVDAPKGEWKNPPHRSHLCGHCGCVWRPCDVATNGVERVKTRGKKDTWPGE